MLDQGLERPAVSLDPVAGSAPIGHLERATVEGRVQYRLLGQPVRSGDVVELFTNLSSGWLRGRFEWSERVDEAPRLAVNLWDPTGPRDEDGLPPWVGELDARLPVGAVLRWPG